MRDLPICDRNRKGFSLVELVVVIALISIIAGFSTPALLSMRAKSNVRADARDVYTTFKYVQSEAVKRSVNIRIVFNSPAAGDYTVFIDDDNDATLDAGELTLSVNSLRSGSSFITNTFANNPGFNARGLPLTTQGSVQIQSSALTMQLSLSNAGFIKSTVL